MNEKKILIVEDDADMRLAYRVFLEAHHYETFFAAESSSAVNEAREHRPDLIILDIGLPSGDGFVVLDRFRANPSLSLIPVIVVSARDAEGTKKRALKAGAKAYLQKPWDDDQLVAIIRELLRQVEASPVGPGS